MVNESCADSEPPAWIDFLASLLLLKYMEYAACLETSRLLSTYDPNLQTCAELLKLAFELLLSGRPKGIDRPIPGAYVSL